MIIIAQSSTILPMLVGEGSESQLKPRFIYDKSLQHSNAPYSVFVDEEGICSALRDFGLSENEVSNLAFRITRASKLDHLLNQFSYAQWGSYDPYTHETTIYADAAWAAYQRALGLAKILVSKNADSVKNPFKTLLKTKRVPLYLKELAPNEKGLAFTQRLLLQAINRTLSSVALHEIEHHLDFRNRTEELFPYSDTMFMACRGFLVGFGAPILTRLLVPDLLPYSTSLWLAAGGAVVGGLGGYIIGYKTSLQEKSAEQFRNENICEVRYRSLITINPK